MKLAKPIITIVSMVLVFAILAIVFTGFSQDITTSKVTAIKLPIGWDDSSPASGASVCQSINVYNSGLPFVYSVGGCSVEQSNNLAFGLDILCALAVSLGVGGLLTFVWSKTKSLQKIPKV